MKSRLTKRVPTFDELGLTTLDGLPVFPVKVERENRTYPGTFVAVFKCPYCKREHEHGLSGDDDPTLPRHRLAHCNPERSPLEEYYIVPDAKSRQMIERLRSRPATVTAGN